MGGDDLQAADAAIELVRACGVSAAKLSPDLKRLATDPKRESWLQLECSLALMFVLPRDELASPFLLASLSDLNAELPLDNAADGLAPRFLGHDLREIHSILIAVPLLVQTMILTDRIPSEIPELLRCARAAPSWKLRSLVLATIAELKYEAFDFLSEIEPFLNDEDAAVRVAAAQAIMSIREDWTLATKLGPKLKLTPEELAEFYRHSIERLRIVIESYSADRMFPLTKVTAAIDLLSMENSVWKRQAINALKKLGPEARVALPELRKLLNADDVFTRRMAQEAIMAIGSESMP